MPSITRKCIKSTTINHYQPLSTTIKHPANLANQMSISSSMKFWRAFTKHGLRLLQMHDEFSTRSSNNGSVCALVKKSGRSNHCQTGQHKLKEATRCSGGVKCRLCSTAPTARDAKHVSAATEGVFVRTISRLYSTTEHQPRGASMGLFGTARRSSRLYSTARRWSSSRLYGNADTSIYWLLLIEKRLQIFFQSSSVVLFCQFLFPRL